MAKNTIGVNLEVTGAESFKSEIKKVNAYINELGKELKEVDSRFDGSSVDDYKEKISKITDAIEAYQKKIKLLNEELGRASDKYGDNSTQVYNLKGKIAEATTEMNKLQSELKQTDDELKNFGDGAQSAGSEFESMFDTMTDSILTADLVSAAVQKIASSALDLAKNVFEAGVNWESAFAGVKKTVDGTDTQMSDLEKELQRLNATLPESGEEIAAVAEAAGQLGIAVDDIAEFTKVMVELGDSTNLTSEEAASALAKFANVMQMNTDNYENLGSTIVALGNNFATTEADIVSMATRIAATGEVVGLTEAQVLALATALSSVGIEAEAGGSAISKLLKKIETLSKTYDEAKSALDTIMDSEDMFDGEELADVLRDLELMAANSSKDFKALADSYGLTNTELKNYVDTLKDLQSFSDVAGMSVEEFLSAWDEDSLVALDAFITGLGNIDANGGSAVATLNELGLTEVRLSNAVLALSSSGGILTETLNTANQAWEENTALAAEAEQRYDTLASKMDIMSGKWEVLNQLLFDSFGAEISSEWVDGWSESIDNLIVKIETLSTQETLGEKLRTLFSISDDAGEIADSISPFHKIVEGIKNLFSDWGSDTNVVQESALALEQLADGILRIDGMEIDLSADSTSISECKDGITSIITAIDEVSGKEIVISVDTAAIDAAKEKVDSLYEATKETGIVDTSLLKPSEVYGSFDDVFGGKSLAEQFNDYVASADIDTTPVTDSIDDISSSASDAVSSLDEVADSAQNVATEAEAMSDTLTTVSGALSGAFESIDFQYFVENWDSVKSVFIEATDVLSNMIPTEFNNDAAIEAFSEIEGAIDDVTTAADSASGKITGLFDAMTNGAPDEADGYSIGYFYALGIAEGIEQGTSEVAQAVSALVSGMVTTAETDLDIHSPSRVARDRIGVNFAKGIGVGFESEMKNVYAQMGDILNVDYSALYSGAVTGINGGAESIKAVFGGYGMDITVPLSIDGAKLAQATSRVEYRNVVNARRANGK